MSRKEKCKRCRSAEEHGKKIAGKEQDIGGGQKNTAAGEQLRRKRL